MIDRAIVLCDEIYNEPGHGIVCKNDKDYCEIMTHRANNTIEIIFRGTDNLRSWKSNFKCMDHDNNGLHDGFDESFSSLVNVIIDDVTAQMTDKITNINVYGHSRGGTFAILMSYNLRTHFQDLKISCMVFGAPRVGGKDWRELFNRSGVWLTRVENPGDPVCLVPFWTIGYRKEGNILRLKQPFWWVFFRLIPFWQHSCKSYKKAIKYTKQKQIKD